MRERRARSLVLTTLAAAVAISLAPASAAAQQAPPARTAGFVTIGASTALFGVGAVFAYLASAQAARLEAFSAMRDPMTGLPLVQYSDVRAVEDQRAVDIGFSIGFFAVGAIGIVTGTVLVLRPSRTNASVAVTPTLGGAAVRVTF